MKPLPVPLSYGGNPPEEPDYFAPTTLGLKREERTSDQVAGKSPPGGCAMIILGDVPVGQVRLWAEPFHPQGLYAAYQRAGRDGPSEKAAWSCAQLHQSDSNLKAMLKYVPGRAHQADQHAGPAAHPAESAGGPLYHRPARQKRYRQITESFGQAAVLAAQGGI